MTEDQKLALNNILRGTLKSVSPGEIPLIAEALETIDSRRERSVTTGPFAFGPDAALVVVLPFLLGLFTSIIKASAEGLGKTLGTKAAEWLTKRPNTPPGTDVLEELRVKVSTRWVSDGLSPPEADRLATSLVDVISREPHLVAQVVRRAEG